MTGAAQRRPRRDSVTYVGHATVLVDLDGVRLLTDPLLRPRLMHLRRTGRVAPDVLRGVDAVLVSHAHWDHLDLPSLERLGRTMPVVCPRGIAPLLRGRRFEHVVELDVGEQVSIGAVGVVATHAEHEGARRPFGAQAPSLGFVVRGSQSVYFAGDTDLFDEMTALAGVDVALLPVAGWGRQLGPGHLDPERAAEALRLLRPRIAVPIHWGTLAPVGRPPEIAAPHEFARHARDVAPGVHVRVLAPGEALRL